jgi:hypothetical protein
VKAEWEPDELIETWTLTGDDRGLVGNKSGATRLGFTVILKFYEIEGRFPAYPEEVQATETRQPQPKCNLRPKWPLMTAF